MTNMVNYLHNLYSNNIGLITLFHVSSAVSKYFNKQNYFMTIGKYLLISRVLQIIVAYPFSCLPYRLLLFLFFTDSGLFIAFEY